MACRSGWLAGVVTARAAAPRSSVLIRLYLSWAARRAATVDLPDLGAPPMSTTLGRDAVMRNRREVTRDLAANHSRGGLTGEGRHEHHPARAAARGSAGVRSGCA